VWSLGAWFSGVLGSVRFIVGLNDLKGLFQLNLSYDSVKELPKYAHYPHAK